MSKDGTVEEGTEGRQPEGSDNQHGQRGSATDADVAKQIAELQKRIDQMARMVQGEKDRAVKKTNERLDVLEGDIRSVLQAAHKEGKGVGDILSELDAAEDAESRRALRELTTAFREGRFPQTGSSGREQGSGVDVSEVLEELELDGTDTRVQEFRSRKFADKAEAYREGAKLLKKLHTIQPTDADRASEVSPPRRPVPKQDELMKEYREGSKNLYGRQLILYKQQMREKGLDIT